MGVVGISSIAIRLISPTNVGKDLSVGGVRAIRNFPMGEMFIRSFEEPTFDARQPRFHVSDERTLLRWRGIARHKEFAHRSLEENCGRRVAVELFPPPARTRVLPRIQVDVEMQVVT